MTWHKTNLAFLPRRQHMECTALDFNNQAVFVGGLDPDQDSEDSKDFNATMDPWDQGIAVFDMTNLQFKDGYSADAPEYVAPSNVRPQYENMYVVKKTNNQTPCRNLT
jgi:hypothetical protein